MSDTSPMMFMKYLAAPTVNSCVCVSHADFFDVKTVKAIDCSPYDGRDGVVGLLISLLAMTSTKMSANLACEIYFLPS